MLLEIAFFFTCVRARAVGTIVSNKLSRMLGFHGCIELLFSKPAILMIFAAECGDVSMAGCESFDAS